MVDVTDAAHRAGWHEPVWLDWAAAGWLAEVVAASGGEARMSDGLVYLLGVGLARAESAGSGWTGSFFATDNAKRPRADGQSWRFVVTTNRPGLDVRDQEGRPFRASFTGTVVLNPLRVEVRLESEANP
jgi:hypothetical protein